MKNINAIKRTFKRVVCFALMLVMFALCACNTAVESEPTAEATEEPTKEVVMTSAIRAKEDMKAGKALGAKSVESAETDASTLPTGYFTKITDVTGRKLVVDVKAGDFLCEAMFEPKEEDKNTSNSGKDSETVESALEKGYIVVSEYVKIIGGIDVTEELQKLIDENPGRTLYFPDGTYMISEPLLTSSDPEKAVSLYLSNFAIIKATNDWKGGDYHMIRLGAKDKTFSIDVVGSNYYMHGGIVDGSGVAKGVSIEGGRETAIRYVSMKNVTQGLHIMYNEECESSDVDLQTVNIVGCKKPDSIGVLVDGYDNNLTNMRVAGFQTAIMLNGARNTLRNLHMLWIYNDASYNYENSVGFWDNSTGNTYDICYPDNFAVGFYMSEQTVSVYNNCYAYWYSGRDGETQIGFKSEGKFNSIVKHCRVDLRSEKVAKYLVVGEAGGEGIIEYPAFPKGNNEDESYKDYLVGKVIWS